MADRAGRATGWRPRRPQRRTRALSTPALVDAATVARIVALGPDRLRNHEITLAYWRLGRRYAALLGTDAASWCTWATWASRTVGHALDPHEHPVLAVELLRRWPGWLRDVVLRIARVARRTLNPRMVGALAEGNREVFREIGGHLARLADALERGTLPDRAAAEAFITALPVADATPFVTTELVARHRRGLLAYVDAAWEPDPGRRLEHVLLGNLLMAEYEQARLQPWIDEAFFVRSNRVGRVRAALQRMWGRTIARVTTRYITAVVTPRLLIPVGAPLHVPAGFTTYEPAGLVPELDPVWRRLRDGARRPCADWSDYPSRMAAVTDMFVVLHREASLAQCPFDVAALADLDAALAAPPGP